MLGATTAGAAIVALVVVATPERLDDAIAPRSRAATQRTSATAAVAGATATSAPHATTTTVAPSPSRFTIAITGDVLLHIPVSDRAAAYAVERRSGVRDFRPMFDPVRKVLRHADLALCHLETPLSVDGSGLHGYPAFNSAPEIAPALADAGYDGCSTASNHTYDQGVAGIAATLDHLDAAHVRHSGSARSADEHSTPTLYDIAGANVAHLAYTTFLNGAHPNERWMINLIDIDRLDQVKSDVATAKGAGADFVIVSVHWGVEFGRTPTAAQRRLAEALTAIDGIDIVVGHHAHVVQPVERINGKWVVFGLGNFLSNQQQGKCCPVDSEDGIVVRITVVRRGDRYVARALDYTPTWVDRTTFRIIPALIGALDESVDASLHDRLARSRERTAEAVRSSGVNIGETRAALVIAT
jgi:poly-gamma-glutamate synthesis protein (capsule biosynthesis protein)